MNLTNAFKFIPGQISPEDALSAGDYPASNSYIDVTGYQWANVVIHLGAIHSSDLPSFEIKEAEATNGTAVEAGEEGQDARRVGRHQLKACAVVEDTIEDSVHVEDNAGAKDARRRNCDIAA